MERYASVAILIVCLWLVVQAWRLRNRRVTIGPAASAMMHQMLNDDRRAAVEIILEERTGYRDPEDRDGNLPELEEPRRSSHTDLAKGSPALRESFRKKG